MNIESLNEIKEGIWKQQNILKLKNNNLEKHKYGIEKLTSFLLKNYVHGESSNIL